LQSAAGDAGWIESLHQRDRLLDLFDRVGLFAVRILTHTLDLFGARHQESLRIQVADDELRDLSLSGADLAHVELP
jgi:hypothetical protein